MKGIGALIGAGITRAKSWGGRKATYRRKGYDFDSEYNRYGQRKPQYLPNMYPQRVVRPKGCRGAVPETDHWYELGCGKTQYRRK